MERYYPEHICKVMYLTHRTDAIGRTIYMRQCADCGAPVGSAIAHDDPSVTSSAPIPPWNDALQQHWTDTSMTYDERQKAWEKKIWWDNYNTYLASPEWRAKSLAVRARDPVCQGCRQNFSEQAHHASYKNVGQEFLFELIALCAKCHDRLHDLKKAQNARYNRK